MNIILIAIIVVGLFGAALCAGGIVRQIKGRDASLDGFDPEPPTREEQRR